MRSQTMRGAYAPRITYTIGTPSPSISLEDKRDLKSTIIGSYSGSQPDGSFPRVPFEIPEPRSVWQAGTLWVLPAGPIRDPDRYGPDDG
jgi:hypothetical protein